MGRTTKMKLFNRTYDTYASWKKERAWQIIPSFHIWYDPSIFLETGVYTPGIGIKFMWLQWRGSAFIQQTY
jgi:hypothetical protein